MMAYLSNFFFFFLSSIWITVRPIRAAPVDDDARHVNSREAHRLVGKSHVTAGEPPRPPPRNYATRRFVQTADGAIWRRPMCSFFFSNFAIIVLLPTVFVIHFVRLSLVNPGNYPIIIMTVIIIARGRHRVTIKTENKITKMCVHRKTVRASAGWK